MTDNNLIEPCVVPDIFCEGLARIDHIGSCRRLIFMVRDVTTPDCKVVVMKIVVPVEAMFDIAQMVAADRPLSPALAAIPHNALPN